MIAFSDFSVQLLWMATWSAWRFAAKLLAQWWWLHPLASVFLLPGTFSAPVRNTNASDLCLTARIRWEIKSDYYIIIYISDKAIKSCQVPSISSPFHPCATCVKPDAKRPVGTDTTLAALKSKHPWVCAKIGDTRQIDEYKMGISMTWWWTTKFRSTLFSQTKIRLTDPST
jgi:hypothetical protein